MCPGSAGVRGGEPPGAGVRGAPRPHAAARAAEPRGDARGARAAGEHGHQGPRLHGAPPAVAADWRLCKFWQMLHIVQDPEGFPWMEPL